MRARRVAAPLAGVILSTWLLTATRGLDQVARGGQIGPGFWPRVVLIGLGLACLAKLIADVRAHHAEAAGMRAAISQRKLIVAVAAIILYVLVTPVIGFALATAAFILGFMWLCGSRSATSLTANAGLGTVVLLYLFIKLVYLPLPKGEGPFETVTLAIYRALRIF